MPAAKTGQGDLEQMLGSAEGSGNAEREQARALLKLGSFGRELVRQSNLRAAERLRLLQLQEELRGKKPASGSLSRGRGVAALFQGGGGASSSSKAGPGSRAAAPRSSSVAQRASKRVILEKQSAAPRTAGGGAAFNRILNEIKTLLWQADRLEQAHGLLIPGAWTQGRFADAKYDFYAFEYLERVPLTIQVGGAEGPVEVYADVGNLYPSDDRFMWHAQLAATGESLVLDLEKEPEIPSAGWVFVSARPAGRSAGPYAIRVSCKQHRKLGHEAPAQGRVNGTGFVHCKYQVPAGHNYATAALALALALVRGAGARRPGRELGARIAGAGERPAKSSGPHTFLGRRGGARRASRTTGLRVFGLEDASGAPARAALAEERRAVLGMM
eukprot:tig00000093_g3607.t1